MGKSFKSFGTKAPAPHQLGTQRVHFAQTANTADCDLLGMIWTHPIPQKQGVWQQVTRKLAEENIFE